MFYSKFDIQFGKETLNAALKVFRSIAFYYLRPLHFPGSQLVQISGSSGSMAGILL